MEAFVRHALMVASLTEALQCVWHALDLIAVRTLSTCVPLAQAEKSQMLQNPRASTVRLDGFRTRVMERASHAHWGRLQTSAGLGVPTAQGWTK